MFMESGNTGRVLLQVIVSFCVFAVNIFFECRADSVLLQRCGLFLRDEDCWEQLLDGTGLRSEMTRAFENPHNQHDAAEVDECRCNRRHCNDSVDVPRRGGACFELAQIKDKST
jgi:hypothetical protein